LPGTYKHKSQGTPFLVTTDAGQLCNELVVVREKAPQVRLIEDQGINVTAHKNRAKPD